ncbi:MAG: pyridoxal-dependent decarboxylase [Pseudobutyrivibrio sp.]|nr:pyridoxal-dependent decarboxylase [Pseudobutyrivibrio sp.]
MNNTPFFLINTNKIDDLLSDMRRELESKWPKAIIGYSFKTNNLPWIIKYMKDKGVWAETVSSDEYNLALELGFSADKIIFNGPVKDKATFLYAVENNSVVNIDSKREINWVLELDEVKRALVKVGLRVNFCIEDYCPGESQCGSDDGRFGFSYENGELEEALSVLEKHGVKVSGLHLHCSSKTRSLYIYRAIAKIAAEISSKYALDLDYVDVGGGFFGGVVGKPSFKDYFEVIHAELSNCDRLKNTNVIIEPGMSLIGASVDYYTSVVDVKNTKNNHFVITDGSRTHIDPLMRKSAYTYHIEGGKDEAVDNQIICGFTCMEGDRFFKYDGKRLQEGDKIVFEKVGAYTMGLSPQFIEFYPAVYAAIGDEIVEARPKVDAKKFVNINK